MELKVVFPVAEDGEGFGFGVGLGFGIVGECGGCRFWAAVITSLASNLKKGLVAFSSAMVEGAVGLFSAVNFCAFFRRSVIAVLFGSTARANLKLFTGIFWPKYTSVFIGRRTF